MTPVPQRLWWLSIVLCLPACCAGRAGAADWPQLQGNAAHSGYTTDQPDPPLKVKWVRQLEQPTFTGAPPSVADGKVFVGTNWGNVLALDRNDGKPLWSYHTDGPVTGTPAFADGIVYATSMDRHCYALRSSDGQRVWKVATGAGIWAAPVVAEGKVFVASRDGFVYALAPADGTRIWRAPVGVGVMATPAYDNGVLYVGGGDNCVHALDAKTGRPIWKTDKLPGQAIRDYWLVAGRDPAGNGVVICTTQFVDSAHGTYRPADMDIMARYRKENDGKPVVLDALLEESRQWLTERPYAQTYHVLDARTGKPRFVAPIFAVHGGGCTAPLPVVAPDGTCLTMFAAVRLAASGWAFAGWLDLNSGALRPLIQDRYWVNNARHEWQARPGQTLARRSMFDVGFCVNDQSWGISRGGDVLYVLRDPGWAGDAGVYSYINLKSGEDRWLTSERDGAIAAANRDGTFGGAFHATCSPMAISGRQLFHKRVRNVVICFEGR